MCARPDTRSTQRSALPGEITHAIAAGVMRADITSPQRAKIWVALAVALFHLVAILALIRAFAPSLPDRVARQALEAVNVTITSPPPSPKPAQDAEKAGAAAEAGRKAVPKETAAPKPKIVLAELPAPLVKSTGTANAAGARDAGQGTGAGGQGTGTGSGSGGDGQGARRATKPVKVAGDINSARDYPPASRDLRIGSEVIIALTVGTDGRVTDCRVHRPSRDAEADRITCRLAVDRFRFRPATDVAGNPVTSVYHWRQWWFDPSTKKS